jgi:hypothetical protein
LQFWTLARSARLLAKQAGLAENRICFSDFLNPDSMAVNC